MTPTSTCDPAPRRPEPRSTVARPRRVVHALALMLGLGLLLSGTTGCLSVQAGSEQRGADVDGIVSGYVSADALRPYDGTILDFGLLKNTEQKGEILSFDLWPIGGFGIGLAGARVRLLPFEVGLGALFYHPDPPEHGGRHHGHHSDDHDHGHHEHRHHDGCDDDCCGECRGGECCGECDDGCEDEECCGECDEDECCGECQEHEHDDGKRSRKDRKDEDGKDEDGKERKKREEVEVELAASAR